MYHQVKPYYELAYEYHVSAATLWTQIMYAPYLYNPISFLLRHTIELLLKGLIIKELKKSNKNLVISEIRIPTERMSSTHSLLKLFNYYKSLLCPEKDNNIEADISFLDKVVLKIDKKDFSSTKYRYPYDKGGNINNMTPVDISLDDKAPDLENGIPYIIQTENNIGIINKGERLLKDTSELFDVVEILFDIIEH